MTARLKTGSGSEVDCLAFKWPATPRFPRFAEFMGERKRYLANGDQSDASKPAGNKER